MSKQVYFNPTHISQTVDTMGCQYIMAYSELGDVWKTVPHRFQMCDSIAQFITSSWFARTLFNEQGQYFIIVGIKGTFRYSEIKSLLDETKENRITKKERDANILFKDKFHLSVQEVENHIRNNDEKTTFNIYLKGLIQDTYLTLRARCLTSNCLYITLPEFLVKSDNVKSDNVESKDMESCI